MKNFILILSLATTMLVTTDTRSNNVIPAFNSTESNLLITPECDLVYLISIEHYLEEGWSRQFSHFLASWNAEQCEESIDD